MVNDPPTHPTLTMSTIPRTSSKGSLSALQDMGDNVSLHGRTRKPSKHAMVSFVVGQDEHEEEQNKISTTFTWTQMLSPIYSLFLILAGLVFIVSEALVDRDIEDRTHHQLVNFYELFLYGGSIVFLLYLLIYIRVTKIKEKRKGREADKIELQAVDNQTVSDDISQVVDIDGKSLKFNYDSNTGPGPTYICQKSPRLGDNSYECHMGSPKQVHKVKDGLVLRVRNIEPRSHTDSTSSMPSRIMLDDQISIQSDCVSNVSLAEDSSEFNEELMLLQQTATQKHEGSCFYLRLGCLMFGIGNLVYTALEIEAYTSLDETCRNHRDLYTFVFHLIFIFVQTFFLFKNTSVMIKFGKPLCRFGYQHVLATNFVIWIRVVAKECLEAYDHHNNHNMDHYDVIIGASADTTGSPALNSTTVKPNCRDSDVIFLSAASPYLFPFILEYSLICAAICAGFYDSLNIVINTDLMKSLRKAIANKHENMHEEKEAAPLFHKAHTGMFLGVVVLTGMIISMILFFLYSRDDESTADSLIYHGSDALTNVLQLSVCLMGLYKFSQMKFSYSRNNAIDVNLLLISLAGLVALEMFNLTAVTMENFRRGYEDPEKINLAVFSICDFVMSIIEAPIQAFFILDALQRSALNKKQKEQKPGRGLVTFLIITNVSQWLMASVTAKRINDQDNFSLKFYGQVAWPIISTIGLPMSLFYRFHSTVCLADIWMAAYENEEEPDYKIL